MDTDPIARTPPDYHYQLTPPTNLLHLTSQFNPLELDQEMRNPSGTNFIVQSTEHAYRLMMEAQGRMHVPVRRATVSSTYVDGEDIGYATYSDGRSQGHIRQQQTSPTSWQRTSGSSGGAWSAQQSPTNIPRGWQQASPRNQGALFLPSVPPLRLKLFGRPLLFDTCAMLTSVCCGDGRPGSIGYAATTSPINATGNASKSSWLGSSAGTVEC
jgi:hypothetical protein